MLIGSAFPSFPWFIALLCHQSVLFHPLVLLTQPSISAPRQPGDLTAYFISAVMSLGLSCNHIGSPLQLFSLSSASVFACVAAHSQSAHLI